MSEFENKKNIKALLWTIGVHAAIFLACFLLAFTSPPPLPNQDMGMEINLGNSPEGTGDIQPLNPNPPAVSAAAPSHAQASPASTHTGSEEEDVATQDKVDAPVIHKPERKVERKTEPKSIQPEKVRKVSRPVNVPVEPKPAPPKPKAIYSGGNSNSSNSGNNADQSNDSKGEGLTGKPGDQGAINGNPNATNHNGTYSGLGGNSLSYKLTGRSITEYPTREGDFNEPGRVRMSIAVDQNGNVTSYRILSADNNTIAQLAIRKIKQLKFNADNNAPVTQFGEVMFVFKLQE
jgi:outer membrane biosynthesis protein TonB